MASATKPCDPDRAGALDLGLAVAGRGLAQDARIGLGQNRIFEEAAGGGHLALLQPQRGGCRPMLKELRAHRRDGGGGTFQQGMAAACIGNGRRQDIAQAHRSVIAQQEHIGVERAGDAGRQQSRARHHVQAEVAECRERRRGRRRPLAADDLRPPLLHGVDHDRHVAAGSVEMRLHDLQGEGRRDGRIEGIAAALQDAHADGSRDPMRRRHDAECALDLRPRRERVRVDETHGRPS